MKQYGVSVFVHIVLLVLFAIACYVLFIHNLWFSTLVAILLLVGTGIHLYVVQMKLAGMMTRLIESIRYNDMTQTFYPPLNNRVMTGMAQELSEALKVFRERLFEEEVKHQYYEKASISPHTPPSSDAGSISTEVCACGYAVYPQEHPQL